MNFKRENLIPVAALLALALTAAPAGFSREESPKPAADKQIGCKVGFVNLAKVLKESSQGQALEQALEAEREKAFAPLKARQAELEQLETQINTLSQEIMQKGQVWDEYTLLSKKSELQNLQMRRNNVYQTLMLDRNKVQKELEEKKNELLKPLEDKLNQIMEDIGKSQGYCMVLDVSPPLSQNMPNFNPIIYMDEKLDITDQVIERVDK